MTWNGYGSPPRTSQHLEEAAALLRKAVEDNERQNRGYPASLNERRERFAKQFAELAAIELGVIPASLAHDLARPHRRPGGHPMTRLWHALAALAVAAVGTLVWANPAAAAPAVPVQAPTLCTVDELQNPANWDRCLTALRADLGQRLDCLNPPTPDTPDSGLAGWFAFRPDDDLQPGPKGLYSKYGLGGYQLSMYATGCAGVIVHPSDAFDSEIATNEFSLATAVISATNWLRTEAYNPGRMWGWSDGFVQDATDALYRHVFGVFGALTLAVVGLWLLWRARDANLPHTVRVAGWAILVMVAVTAVGRWPMAAAHGADQVATTGLAALHSVVGPPPATLPPDKCFNPDPGGCVDRRTVAVRASDVVTEAVLYRAWLRAELGSDSSPTAKRYGAVLYDASTLSWAEATDIANDPNQRQIILAQKADHWITVAEQIKTSDPAAYEHLQGLHGSNRIGAGAVALGSAVVYSGFDAAASLVILFGFVVFRFAVILTPLLGTIGLLEPASAGLRRVANAVVTSLFNIVLFGAGAGAYLWWVTWITSLQTLPGPVQVAAVFAAGVACWLLLRPIRRLYATTGRHPDTDRTSRLTNLIKKLATAAATATTGPAGTAAGTAAGTIYATVVTPPAARPHGSGPAPGSEQPAITGRPETLGRQHGAGTGSGGERSAINPRPETAAGTRLAITARPETTAGTRLAITAQPETTAGGTP